MRNNFKLWAIFELIVMNDCLLVFREVAELQSVTKAAQKLHLSQPASRNTSSFWKRSYAYSVAHCISTRESSQTKNIPTNMPSVMPPRARRNCCECDTPEHITGAKPASARPPAKQHAPIAQREHGKNHRGVAR
jgi:regulatory helix-turn-helix LysR family protein